MNLKAKIETVNSLFNEIRVLKENAEQIEGEYSYTEASSKHDVVAEKVSKIFSGNNNPEFLIAKVCEHYLQYEKQLYLSIYNCSSDNYSEAEVAAEGAQVEIGNTLEAINSALERNDSESEKFLLGMRKKMRSAEISIKARLIEPYALKAIADSNYTEAIDRYSDMVEELRKLYEFNKHEPLERSHIRISEGKIKNAKANRAIAYAKNTKKRILNKMLEGELSNDLIKHNLHAYNLLIKADDANPETGKFRIKADVIKRYVKKTLEDNKKNWPRYAIEFGDNPMLLALMEPEGNYKTKFNSLRNGKMAPIPAFQLEDINYSKINQCFQTLSEEEVFLKHKDKVYFRHIFTQAYTNTPINWMEGNMSLKYFIDGILGLCVYKSSQWKRAAAIFLYSDGNPRKDYNIKAPGTKGKMDKSKAQRLRQAILDIGGTPSKGLIKNC